MRPRTPKITVIEKKTATPAQRRRRRRIAAGVAAVIAIIAGILLWPSFEDKDVREIERRIELGKRAAAAKDVDACLALLDESYSDNFNNTYATVRNRARVHIDEVTDLNVKTREMRVEVDKAKGLAMAKFEVRITGRYDDGGGNKVPFSGVVSDINPLSPNWETVTLLWAKRGDAWLVTRLYIEPVKKAR